MTIYQNYLLRLYCLFDRKHYMLRPEARTLGAGIMTLVANYFTLIWFLEKVFAIDVYRITSTHIPYYKELLFLAFVMLTYFTFNFQNKFKNLVSIRFGKESKEQQHSRERFALYYLILSLVLPILVFW